MAKPIPGDRYHHLKRGSNYTIVGEVRLNTAAAKRVEYDGPVDGDILTLYLGDDGTYSARDPEEFLDGRFVKI
jgi:hypothetical protein